MCGIATHGSFLSNEDDNYCLLPLLLTTISCFVILSFFRFHAMQSSTKKTMQGLQDSRNDPRVDLCFDSCRLCQLVAGRTHAGTLRPRRSQEEEHQHRRHGHEPVQEGKPRGIRRLRLCGVWLFVPNVLSVESSLSAQYSSLSLQHGRMGAAIRGNEGVVDCVIVIVFVRFRFRLQLCNCSFHTNS